MRWVFIFCVLVPIFLTNVRGENSAENDEEATGRGGENVPTYQEVIQQLLKSCRKSDFPTCLGTRLVRVLNRLARVNQVPIIEGITIVRRNTGTLRSQPMSETDIIKGLPGNQADKMMKLLRMAGDQFMNIFRDHTVQFRLLDAASSLFRNAFDSRSEPSPSSAAAPSQQRSFATYSWVAGNGIKNIYKVGNVVVKLAVAFLLVAGVVIIKNSIISPIKSSVTVATANNPEDLNSGEVNTGLRLEQMAPNTADYKNFLEDYNHRLAFNAQIPPTALNL